ncbi:cell wall hydrolase [Lachnospiraceae bacterium JLR.KK008]
MKGKGRRLLRRLSGMLMGVTALGLLQLTAAAGNTDSFQKLNAGAAVVLEADLTDVVTEGPEEASASRNVEEKEERDSKGAAEEDDAEESNLVMANVQNAVNVRKEADEDSERVGKLYSDCGGEVLERRNGWTKLKSGNVTGWTKDEYLLFGKEAEEMAEDVGNLIAKVDADALRIRKEPEEDADVYGMAGKDEKMDALEVIDDDWISVEYEGEIGYVSAKYTTIEFIIDSGETMDEIHKREEKEQEEKRKADEAKAKQKENRGAVAVEAADDILLAALIQCEAGNQSYEGQLAVGAVVMNRVRSGGYPNTISGVIYASGQFTPALNGKVAKRVEAGVRDSCLQAAREAIAGVSNVGGATHFRRAGNHEGQIIGSHVFW